MALRSPKRTPDVDGLRHKLADLDAELADLDAQINAATARREALSDRLDQVGDDIAARWQIEEDLDEVRAEIQTLLDAKVRPQLRAGHLRSALTPVLQREREATRRAAKLAEAEQLLEAHALLQRVGAVLAEARRAGRADGSAPDFDASIHKLDQVVRHWDEAIAPRLRQHTVEHRRFLATFEDQR